MEGWRNLRQENIFVCLLLFFVSQIYACNHKALTMRDGKWRRKGNEMRKVEELETKQKTRWGKIAKKEHKDRLVDSCSCRFFFFLNDWPSCSSSLSLFYHFFLPLSLFLHCSSMPSSLTGISGKLSPDLDLWPLCHAHRHRQKYTFSYTTHTHKRSLTLFCVQQLTLTHTHTIVVDCSKFLYLYLIFLWWVLWKTFFAFWRYFWR